MKKFAAPILFLSCFAAECQADFIPGLTVDRANQFYNQGLNYSAFTPIGEFFTPTLDGIQWAAIAMQDFTPNPTMGGVFDIELFQGIGTSGTLLATSAATNLPPGFGIPGPGAYAYFFFASEVALTPGTPYTLILDQLSGEGFFVLAASLGQPGNQAILHGQPQTNFNLTFGEGLGTVPEPSSLTLLGIAALGLPFVIHRSCSTAGRAS